MLVGEAPKMFKIGDHTDQIKAFRVSKDAVLAAAVLGNDEIHIYRVSSQAGFCMFMILFQLFDAKGEYLGDKKVMAPINKLKIKDPEFSNVIDLHLYKRQYDSASSGQPTSSQGGDYYLYVVSTNGVLIYSQIEKKADECKVLNEEWSHYTLTPNCADINSFGHLLIDAALKPKDGVVSVGEDLQQQKYFMKKFAFRECIQNEPLDGVKEKLRFFKDNQIVELKTIKNGTM